MAKEFKAFLKTVGGNEGDVCRYSTRLDLYGCGCSHDCKYCYAKSLLDFRRLWHPLDPYVADPEKVRRAVRRLAPGSIVRLGGMTDCFQPAERTHRATLNAIRALNERGVGYLIITKSPLVAEEEYLAEMRADLAHIQVTVTTLDDALAARYEKAPPSSERVNTILLLQDAGFDVQMRLSPYMPDLMNADALAKTGVRKLLVEFLRVNHWIRKWMDGICDLSIYTRTFHGYDHIPFDVKLELARRLAKSHEVTVCDFDPEHLDFWKKEFNPNPADCCNLRHGGEEYRTPGEALARLAFPMPSKCPPEMEGRAEMPLFTNPPFAAS